MEIPVLEEHIVLDSFAIEFSICVPQKDHIGFEGQFSCFEIELSHSSDAL